MGLEKRHGHRDCRLQLLQVLAAAWAMLSFFGSSTASAAENGPFARFTWVTPPGAECVESRTIELEVESRLNRSDLFHETGSSEVEDLLVEATLRTEEAASTLEILLKRPGGAILGDRLLRTHNCEELRAVLPVILAVMLRPYLATSTSGSSTNGEDVTEQSAETSKKPTEQFQNRDTKPSEDRPPRAARRSDQARPKWPPPRGLMCGASAGSVFGFGPNLAGLRGMLTCRFSLEEVFVVEADLEARAPNRSPDPDFSLWGLGGRAGGCALFGGATEIGPCAGIGLMHVVATAELEDGTKQSQGRTAAEVSAWLRLQSRIGPVVLALDAGANVPSERPKYQWVGSDPEQNQLQLHQTWPVRPTADFALLFVFE